jgi:hypothetical protein
MHVHLSVLDSVVGRVLGHGRALVVALFFVFLLVDWIHSIHLVGFALVVLLLFSSELLPGVTDQTSDGTTLGRNSSLGLLETKDVSGEEHVVTRLVTLAVGLLVWRLVLGHLLLVTLAIFASSVW